MKKANARELKHETSNLLDLVERGESIEITRRGKVIALLSPLAREETKKIERFDFKKSIHEIFGDRLSPTTGTELMEYDRGDR